MVGYFGEAKLLKKMKLTKKAKEKLRDKTIKRVLEDKFKRSSYTLDKWRAKENSPFYSVDVIKDFFLKTTGLTEEEAFE